MQLIDKFNKLSKNQKILIITLVVILSLLVLFSIFFVSKGQRSEHEKQESGQVVSNTIKDIAENKSDVNQPKDQIIYNGIDLGLAINSYDQYKKFLSTGKECNEDKNILSLFQENEAQNPYVEEFKTFSAVIAHRKLTSESEFEQYRQKFLNYNPNKDFISNQSALKIGCSGAGYWHVTQLRNKLNFEDSFTHLFVGGTHFAAQIISHENMTVVVFAYDNENLIQANFEFNLSRFVPDEYKNDCFVDPYQINSYPSDYQSNYIIDNVCLAQKLSNDVNFIQDVSEYIEQRIVEIGLRKTN